MKTQSYWGVPLMEHARDDAESLKLTDPKYVMERAGANAGDCLCERYVTRLQAIPVLLFPGVSVCQELRLLDAPATLNGRRQGASTLQMLKSVAANRNSFPERSQQSP